MSATKEQILANRANAQKSTGPKTGRGTPASSNWATTPNQPEEKKESFKNGETNPFCRLPATYPIPSPATNKQKVIMFFGGTKILKAKPIYKLPGVPPLHIYCAGRLCRSCLPTRHNILIMSGILL